MPSAYNIHDGRKWSSVSRPHRSALRNDHRSMRTIRVSRLAPGAAKSLGTKSPGGANKPEAKSPRAEESQIQPALFLSRSPYLPPAGACPLSNAGGNDERPSHQLATVLTTPGVKLISHSDETGGRYGDSSCCGARSRYVIDYRAFGFAFPGSL